MFFRDLVTKPVSGGDAFDHPDMNQMAKRYNAKTRELVRNSPNRKGNVIVTKRIVKSIPPFLN